MSSMKGANAYARVGVESKALSASPHELISMLYDGLISSVRAAKLLLNDNQVNARGLAISKALDIINEGLVSALDPSHNPEVADSLAQLYGFASRLLLRANIEQSNEPLDQVLSIIEPIADAWKSVASSSAG